MHNNQNICSQDSKTGITYPVGLAEKNYNSHHSVTIKQRKFSQQYGKINAEKLLHSKKYQHFGSQTLELDFDGWDSIRKI